MVGPHLNQESLIPPSPKHLLPQQKQRGQSYTFDKKAFVLLRYFKYQHTN